jgi:hypothetical protein
MMTEKGTNTWLAAWRQAILDHLPRNRREAPWLWILAAQAEADPSLARRMAVVEVLEDGRPHPGPDLRTAVEKRLGEGCFGAQAEQTLEADIAALRAWGIRIGHSDSLEVEGCYLRDPAVVASRQRLYEEEPNPLQIETYRTWDNARKMRSMFEMFDLAMHRARMGVRARHPDWDDKRVEARARELVTHQSGLVKKQFPAFAESSEHPE